MSPRHWNALSFYLKSKHLDIGTLLEGARYTYCWYPCGCRFCDLWGEYLEFSQIACPYSTNKCLFLFQNGGNDGHDDGDEMVGKFPYLKHNNSAMNIPSPAEEGGLGVVRHPLLWKKSASIEDSVVPLRAMNRLHTHSTHYRCLME